jgi:hypothetical protein
LLFKFEKGAMQMIKTTKINGFEIAYTVAAPRCAGVVYSPGSTVREIGTVAKVDAAINFSFADTGAGVPIGRLIVGGRVVVPDIPKTALRDELWSKDGVLHISKAPANADWAVQGSPRLLENGAKVINTTAQRDQTPADVMRSNYHTAAGITRQGEIVLVRTMDKTTMDQLADIMLLLGCVDALNGDGGGSSYFWPHDSGWCRKLGSAIVLEEGETKMTYKVDHIPLNTPANRRPGKKMTPTTITIHNTANATSTAANERTYLTNTNNKNTASFHIVIDQLGAIECVPLNEVAWHAGDGSTGPGNTTSIGIELCESGDYWQTYTNAVDLVASMLLERGWGVDRLRRHYDWSGKICPRLMYDGGTWAGWKQFKQDVQDKLPKANPTPATPKLKSVNVMVKGQPIKDGFLVDGTSYIPLRAAGEALGMRVGWDQKSNTASLG